MSRKTNALEKGYTMIFQNLSLTGSSYLNTATEYVFSSVGISNLAIHLNKNQKDYFVYTIY